MEGSNWVISAVHALELNTAKYDPVPGGSSYIELPPWLKRKTKSFINIKNYDRDCFRLSVMAGIMRSEAVEEKTRQNLAQARARPGGCTAEAATQAGADAERQVDDVIPRITQWTRPQTYAHRLDELNMKGIPYSPMHPHHLKKFESQNEVSISLLGLAYENRDLDEPEEEEVGLETAAQAARQWEDLYQREAGGEEEEEGDGVSSKCPQDVKKPQGVRVVIRHAPEVKKRHHITLMLIEDHEQGRSHYVLVTSIHTLLASLRKSRRKLFFCCYCLGAIYRQEDLEPHENVCKTFGAQRVLYMGGKATFDRTDWRKMQRSHCTVYYDLECALKPCHPSTQPKTTERTQEHRPFAYCMVAVGFDGQLLEKITRHGSEEEDVVGWFLSDLLALEERLWASRPNYKVSGSEEQIQAYRSATTCYLCGESFPSEEPEHERHGGRRKIREHDHLLPRNNMRGAAHSVCNASLPMPSFLAVVGHNANRSVSCQHCFKFAPSFGVKCHQTIFFPF